MSKYLFVLCPPYSGSTVLWRLLAASPNVSAFAEEGQFLNGVREMMRSEPWNTKRRLSWDSIKREWDNTWDPTKPIQLEKSPPNLSRAFEIEKTFIPSYFIAMIQNPYAHCEGLMRRGSTLSEGMEGAAKFWVRCAQYQRKNIQGLSRVINFTYETFTENPSLIREQIIDFIPELQKLDTNALFNVNSVVGSGPKKIVNLTPLKINLLSPMQVSSINGILKQYPDLMEFFGYSYINPTIAHSIRHFRTITSVSITRAVQRIKNLRRQVIDRVGTGLKNSGR
jgi:hypothetical protein